MLPLPTEARRWLSGAPGTALIASGRDLQAVRLADGTQMWRATLPAPILNRVVVDGGRAFAGLGDSSLVALDTATGAMVWRRPLTAVPGPLAAAAGHVYFGGSDHACHAYRQSDGEQAWWYLKRAPVAGRPAGDAKHAYFVLLTNVVLALDRDTGNERWDERVSARLAHGLDLAGEALFMALGDGTALMLRAADGRITTIRAAPKPGERGDGVQVEAMSASADGTRVYTLTEMAAKFTLSAYAKK
jgi:outer membrane protein assembly factor BamB